MYTVTIKFLNETKVQSFENEVEAVEWIFDEFEVGGLYRDDPEFPTLEECINSTNEIDPECYQISFVKV